MKEKTVQQKKTNKTSNGGETAGKITGYQARLYMKKDVSPKFIKARRVAFPLLKSVEAELESQVEQGLLVKVDRSEWATPIVAVPKRNGKIRICGDYKVTVNPALEVDEHPLPTIDELFSTMAGGVKFSKIDLAKAYLQLEIHPDDRHILTLNTHKGLYQPTRMMFGIACAPAKWQRYMEQLLGDLPGVKVFLDDIKITASDDVTHLQRIDEVLRRLNKHNMRVNLEKSQFLQDRIEYCGYVIDKEGIRKLESKVEAIQQMKQPTTKDEVRAFLGLVNYYGRFIKNLSDIVYPLNRLLHHDVQFKFNSECKKAFCEVKRLMQSNTVLTHYDPQLPVILAVDASPIGVGAVLSHLYKDGTEKPIQFASQTLNKVQQRYSQVDKEAYAIIFGVRKFYQYLFGRKFILVTDNKAIAQIFSPNKGLPTLSATRMQHYAIYLESFDYEIRIKKSKENANADAMSRLPCAETYKFIEEVDVIETEMIENLPVTVAELGAKTQRDSEVRLLLECLKYGRECEPKHRFGITQTEFTLQKDCLLRGIRVYIPEELRKKVLDELHTGHFGTSKMKTLARSYCWWSQIDRDIEDLVSNCAACQATRADSKAIPVHCWMQPSKVFERVHADYAGPFMGKYLFVLVDAFSKWPEVRIVPNMTTETTIRVCEEIFATFGYPNVFVSDHGTQFNSKEFQKFLAKRGIVHKQGAPYHPATNGQAERFVQTFKNKLKTAMCKPSSMHEDLATILMAYRRAVHPVTNKSPAMMMFGRQIQSRLDLLLPQNVITNQIRKIPQKHFKVGERVAVRDYISDSKWRFGRVSEVNGDLHYRVNLDDGRSWNRHVDQMRRVGDKLQTQWSEDILRPELETVIPLDPGSDRGLVGMEPSATRETQGQTAEVIVEDESEVQKQTTDVGVEVAPETERVEVENGTKAKVLPGGIHLRRSNRTIRVPERLQYGKNFK